MRVLIFRWETWVTSQPQPNKKFKLDNADSNNNPGAQNAQGLGRLPAALSSTGAENGWPLELHVHAGDTGQDTVKGTYGMYMGRGGTCGAKCLPADGLAGYEDCGCMGFDDDAA